MQSRRRERARAATAVADDADQEVRGRGVRFDVGCGPRTAHPQIDARSGAHDYEHSVIARCVHGLRGLRC